MKPQTQSTQYEEREEIDFLQPLSIGCGLDMHKDSIQACIMKKGFKAEIRGFGTTTDQLREVVDWIVKSRVEAVAVESTGIYWYSMYQLLEEAGIPVKLVNPARANIKIRSVMSNITTKSGQAIVSALANGETNVDLLAKLCKGRLRKKMNQMKVALAGLLTEDDRFQLRMLLKDQDHYKMQITELEAIADKIVTDHFAEAVEIVDSIHGIGVTTATSIIAEIGPSMDQFQTADKLTNWSGLAPGNKESAGKKRKVRTVNGNRYIKPVLIQAAWATVRAKDTYWAAQYNYLTRRLPAKKAIIAIARKMLKMIFNLLQKKVKYVELGLVGFRQMLENRIKIKHQLTA